MVSGLSLTRRAQNLNENSPILPGSAGCVRQQWQPKVKCYLLAAFPQHPVQQTMSEEIELKFIVHPDSVDALREQLNHWQSEFSHCNRLQACHLANIYYETPDGYLRANGIGLRVRGENGRYEMTAKTAGKVVGGLHQHPEYNVALTGPELAVALLPAEIWPEGCDVAWLASALNPLFSTDFSREVWAVTYRQSVLEVAFDRGEVVAGEQREPICELELELKVGRQEDLLSFADELVDIGGLRQGSLSKAARGYHLAKGNPPRERRPLGIVPTEAKMTLDQGIAAGLEYALAHWQYHEELWARGDSEARLSLRDAAGMMRELLVLVGGVVPRKVTTLFRAALNNLEALVESSPDAEPLCYQSHYLKDKMVLVSWLLEDGWRQHMDNRERMRLQSAYKRFADIMMSRCLADLKTSFGRPLDALHYAQQLPRLQRGLFAFLLLGGFYPEASVRQYLRLWHELNRMIAELPSDSPVPDLLEACRRAAISQPQFWLHSGQ